MATTHASERFVDTNGLIHATNQTSEFHEVATTALPRNVKRGVRFCISTQVLREYLAVSSRPPATKEAVGWERIFHHLNAFRNSFRILDDTEAVAVVLQQPLDQRHIGGRRVDDANIAATMQVYGLVDWLTHNVADFVAFSPPPRIHTLLETAASRAKA